VTDTLTFADLGLHEKTLTAVAESGYIHPTHIQQQAIPVVLEGRDVLGCAQTGTGKTASYTLPLIERLITGRARARMPRCLILAPTREIAMQVEENFAKYGKYHRLSTALLIGGMSPVEQERALLRGVDVLIATPGRLLEHFEKGKIILNDVRYLIIDEADRMLDMGFIPDIEIIVAKLPRTRQTLMFSATMPKAIRTLAEQFLHQPVEITITPKAMTAANVTQYVVPAPDDFAGKRAVLRALIAEQAIAKAIIFLNRKRDVDILAKSLQQHGYRVAAMHGDMTQGERLRTLDQFKADGFDFLVASDVAARGIHVEGLPAVINFDVPHIPDDYVHRIGRTGRAGQMGRAYTIASAEHGKYLEAVVDYTRTTFTRLELAVAPSSGAATDTPRRERAGRGEAAGRSERSHRTRRATAPRATPADAPQPEAGQPETTDVAADSVTAPKRPRRRTQTRTSAAAVDATSTGASTAGITAPAAAPVASPRHRSARHADDNAGEQSPQGLGDHVPAFLLGR
jgi:superfamily II DNA/RNA helicase